MTKSLRPYLFLTILIVILSFIIGMRYGQKVEKTNKTIDYLLRLTPPITPTSPTTPTPTNLPTPSEATATPTVIFKNKK